MELRYFEEGQWKETVAVSESGSGLSGGVGYFGEAKSINAELARF